MEGLKADQRVHVEAGIAVGSFSTISSTSMPPMRESIAIGFLAPRSKTTAA